VCKSFIQWMSDPEWRRNPKNVVTNTKKLSLTFISTAKSWRNPGGSEGASSSETVTSLILDSSIGAAEP
jgi:hypothetical protein